MSICIVKEVNIISSFTIIFYIVRRIILAIPTLLAVIVVVFLLVHLVPGNPFQTEKALSAQALIAISHEYRLDLPLHTQLFYYLKDLLHGDFGKSYRLVGESITNMIFPDDVAGFWLTCKLACYTLCVALPLGFIMGCYAGVKENSWFDHIIVSLNIIFNALPAIVIAPLLVLIFASTLHCLPASGYANGDISHLILPILTLLLAYMPTIAFITRGAMAQTMQSRFILTAYAKGLPLHIIVLRHAIKPTLLPVISLLGPMFASIFIGAIVTEQVFALPGLGILTTQAAVNRDYNLILAITILGSGLTIFFNLVVDIIYFALDPRIKQ